MKVGELVTVKIKKNKYQGVVEEIRISYNADGGKLSTLALVDYHAGKDWFDFSKADGG